MNQARCKCGKVLDEVSIEEVKMKLSAFPDARGMSFSCPHCHTVLGVELDPFWLQGLQIEGVRSAVAWQTTQKTQKSSGSQ